MNSSAPAVRLVAVTKAHAGGERVFRDFNLTIPTGQVVAVVGRSGVGKSTLLQLISLLAPVDQGTIELFGEPVTTADIGRIAMDYLFQVPALLPWRTIEENLLLTASCRGETGAEVLARAKSAIADIGLASRINERPNRLSGGQRQLVALANTLMLDSELLLLDEPTSSLDFHTKMKLEGRLAPILRRSHSGKPRTSVLITHDIFQALVLADRLLVLTRSGCDSVSIASDISIPGEGTLARGDKALQEIFVDVCDVMMREAL